MVKACVRVKREFRGLIRCKDEFMSRAEVYLETYRKSENHEAAIPIVTKLTYLTGLLLLAVCGVSQAKDSNHQDCVECPVMVRIPPGKFMMGDADGSSAASMHKVKLNYPFAIGQTEVTEAQFRFFLKRTGYNPRASHLASSFSPKLPAVEVDWFAATAYSRWLSRYTGKHYRLPSESEWDYAAHAGKSTRYWWGDAAIDGCGKEQLLPTFFPFDHQCASTRKAEPIDVASLSANPWGLYDMQGNVGEWMQDCWSDNYRGVPADGTPYRACDKDSSSMRVVRGPDFLDTAAPRRLVDSREHSPTTGFRVVRELP